MATSSKVQFNLETLKAEALKSIDFRIEQKRAEVESYADDAYLEQQIDDWRARQEERISDLFRRLNDDTGIDNASLARWSIQPIPEVNTYDRSRAQRDLNNLESLRTKIVAKTESLVPDSEGNISLTKTQLAEFFGL